MSKLHANIEVRRFMEGPLVTCFKCFLDEELESYEDLLDGVLLHKVFMKIHSVSQNSDIIPSKDDPIIRLRNLHLILENIKHVLEGESSFIVLQTPNVLKLAKEPFENVNDAKLFLYLLLYSAIQRPCKEISGVLNSSIQSNNDDKQSSFVDYVKNIKQEQHIVLPLNSISDEAIVQIRNLVDENNKYRIFNLVNNGFLDESMESVEKMNQENHYFENYNEQIKWQQKYMEEMEDDLNKCEKEIETYKEMLEKYKLDNNKLQSEVASLKIIIENFDIISEKAKRVDELESEISRYKDVVYDSENLKHTVIELKKHIENLTDTKENMQDELNYKIIQLTKMNKEYKYKVEELSFKVEEECQNCKVLYQENKRLEGILKFHENKLTEATCIDDSDESFSFENNLADELSKTGQSREMKLESENKKLSILVDSLKESAMHNKNFNLEKDKNDYNNYSSNIDKLNNEIQDLSEDNKNLKQSLKNQVDTYEMKVRDLERQINVLKENNDIQQKRVKNLQLLLENAQNNVEDCKSNNSDNVESEKILKPKLEIKYSANIISVNNKLYRDYQNLKADFQNLYKMTNQLELKYKKSKEDLCRVNTKYLNIQKIINEKNEKIINSDLKLEMLSEKLALEYQKNIEIQDSKKSLMQHVTQLSIQYHDLITKSLEERKNFHNEEKKNIEKTNDLIRHKEKLEQKIIELYRKMENSPLKKTKTSFAKRMRKVGSDIINISRISWLEKNNNEKQRETCSSGFSTDHDIEYVDFSVEEERQQSSSDTDMPLKGKSSRVSELFNNKIM